MAVPPAMNTLQALGAPRRRAILRMCWEGERSAGEIHRDLGDVTFGAVSQQLRRLTDANLLSCRRQGRLRLYRARREGLGALEAWLEQMWAGALDQLAMRAELEDARRGPRPHHRSAGSKPAPTPRGTRA
jgi:DNA-binding transcriptional ArsR family regulator